jgi:hypothetical protein
VKNLTGAQAAYCEEQERLGEEWVSKAMARVVRAKERATEELRALFGATYEIDEMALMFTDAGWLQRWVTSAVRVPGMALFNAANDHVRTRPIPSSYDVHYWFLSTPRDYHADGEWRLEAMIPHPGSPLHDTLLHGMPNETDITVVHASFKCPDEEAYAVAVKTFKDGAYEAAQLCDSTYGKFSYWSPLDREDRAPSVYLKPRVNLRDQEDRDDA